MNCQRCKQSKKAFIFAFEFNDFKKGPYQICEACIKDLEKTIEQIDKKVLKGEVTNIEEKVDSLLEGEGFEMTKNTPKNNIGDVINDIIRSAQQGNVEQQQPQQKKSFLEQIANDLTNDADKGRLDKVIGRQSELTQLIETLNRKDKNNPILIGEPGVGKTAVIEALAQLIANNDYTVPRNLQNKRIFSLNISAIKEGTGIMGEFERKMNALIAEINEARNIILFIDEIHTIMGGGGKGQLDFANILKPALSRGQLQIIGATTLKEYRMIEKDPALERRFQPIMVNEPTKEEAIEILEGIRHRYEDYHGVTYTDEAIKSCVELSQRFIQSRFLPDKAIDLLDHAGSRVNLQNSDLEKMKIDLDQVVKEKERALINKDFMSAKECRDRQTKLEKELFKHIGHSESVKTVSLEEIANVVELKTGIPVRKIKQNEGTKLKSFGNVLGKRVIGQGKAVKEIAKAIKRSRAGLSEKGRPTGSFIFAGPTGVGKTELAKVLTEELLGDSDAMIRLDMSEYMEKHAVSKLIGSPPGYIGHDEAGQLTEKVRRKPYSVVLLDEIEKAHPEVQNMFLQILDEGQLTDSQGTKVSFKDTIIIATTNAGSSEKKTNPMGFGKEQSAKKEELLDNLSVYFRPEFLNRFDAVIPFEHLKEADILQIVDLVIGDTEEKISEQGYTLKMSKNAKQKIAELGYNKKFGARELKRVVRQEIEDRLTDSIIDNPNKKTFKIGCRQDTIYIS